MNHPADEARLSIAAEPSNAQQRRLAGSLIWLILVGFGVVFAYARYPLPRSDGFVPAAQSVIFAFDLLTAIILYAQFAVSRSRALLALATGYLGSALFAAAHTLTFPGVFAPDGLFGASGDTAGWVYIAWHACFPLGALAYCLLGRAPAHSRAAHSVARSLLLSVAGAIALVTASTWMLISAADRLPVFLVGLREFNPLVRYVSIGNLLVAGAALVLLQRRRRTVLDEWLRVAVAAAVAECALIVLVAGRFTVGFYAVRLFAIVVSGAVLVALLWEITRLFARHAKALDVLESERANKLMSFGLMVGAVAHEIKQPLAVIALRTCLVRRLLREPRPDFDQLNDSLDEVEHAGDRVTETIDGIRALFRNSADDHESIDVDEDLVQATARLLEPELEDHEIALELESDFGLPAIRGHRRQLQEVMLNIARNAIESMQAVDDRPRILRFRTERAGAGRVAVTIGDTGDGIPPERLANLFEALTTTKCNGTGLGLGICRMIIDRHHGELGVESALGSGTEFRIVLPARVAEPAPARRAEADARPRQRESAPPIRGSA